MKKVFYPFILLLAASVIFTGCHSDDDETDSNVARFTTTSPWTSSVRETTAARATVVATAATQNTADWLTFSPESGGAGAHAIVVNVTPNRTGALRTAVITIEGYFEIFVRNYYQGGGRDLVAIAVLEVINPDIQEFANRIFPLFLKQHNPYYELDNRYSTLMSRQTLSPQTSVVSTFWNSSYSIIGAIDEFLTKEMLKRRLNADEKRVFLDNKGRLLAMKGVTYFYLNTMFGCVPIMTERRNPDYLPFRTSGDEISEYVRTNLHEGLPYLYNAQNRRSWDYELIALSYRTLALIALQKQEYQQATDYLRQSIGVLHNTHTTHFLYAEALTQTYLLYAETLLKIGQKAQAIARVNQVLQQTGKELLSLDATDNEVLVAIKESFSDVDSGMKFLNAVRWGETKSWGFRALLPIPQQEIWRNPNMVQNPGW